MDLASYSLRDLYAAGLRFVGDYNIDDCVEQYVELHPGADAAKVRAELEAWVATF